jgi:hypothetical protein
MLQEQEQMAKDESQGQKPLITDESKFCPEDVHGYPKVVKKKNRKKARRLHKREMYCGHKHT